MTDQAPHVEREFVCFNCGQYWSVYENYEIRCPNEPANICPECGSDGHLNGTYVIDEKIGEDNDQHEA